MMKAKGSILPESVGVKQQSRKPGRAERPVRLAATAAAAVTALLVASPALAAGDLVLLPQPALLLVLLVGFVALIPCVNALIFKPIFHALDERENRIAGARRRASYIENQANELLTRYEDSIREARISAEASRKELIAEARAEQTSIGDAARGNAEQKIDEARAELGRSLDGAREGLRASSQDLARAAAERILGRSLT